MAPVNATPAGIKFTVVIPTFNSSNTIEATLSSVLKQSYPAYEIIVVDDASTDDTAVVVENIASGTVKYIQKIHNSGSSSARNKGIDAATGDYIAFLDADDLWHEDKLMLLNTILSTQRGVDFFFHPYVIKGLMGKRLPENIQLFRLPFVKLLYNNPISTSCALIRNKKEFQFETTMRYAEDYDMWLRIGYKYKIYFISIPLTQLGRPVLSPGGVSENRWKMRKGEMKAYSRLYKLNPLFLALTPMLLVSSLGKHVVKMITKK